MYQKTYKLNETKDKVITYVIQPINFNALEKLAIASIKKCPKLYDKKTREIVSCENYSTKEWKDSIEFINENVFCSKYSGKIYEGSSFDRINGNFAGNGCDHYYTNLYNYSYDCYWLEKHFAALLKVFNNAEDITSYYLSKKNLIKCREYVETALTFTDEDLANLDEQYFDYFSKCCSLIFNVQKIEIANFKTIDDLINIFLRGKWPYWYHSDDEIFQQYKEWYDRDKNQMQKFMKERKIESINDFYTKADDSYYLDFFKTFNLTDYWLDLLGTHQLEKVENARKRLIKYNKN